MTENRAYIYLTGNIRAPTWSDYYPNYKTNLTAVSWQGDVSKPGWVCSDIRAVDMPTTSKLLPYTVNVTGPISNAPDAKISILPFSGDPALFQTSRVGNGYVYTYTLKVVIPTSILKRFYTARGLPIVLEASLTFTHNVPSTLKNDYSIGEPQGASAVFRASDFWVGLAGPFVTGYRRWMIRLAAPLVDLVLPMAIRITADSYPAPLEVDCGISVSLTENSHSLSLSSDELESGGVPMDDPQLGFELLDLDSEEKETL